MTISDAFHIYDTTLRDGAQQERLNLSVHDKLSICGDLDGKKSGQNSFEVFIPNKFGKVVRIVGDVECSLVGDAGYFPAKWVAFMRRLNPYVDFRVKKKENLRS